MHIVIKSGKHDSSTGYTHGRDFEKLLTLAEYDTVTLGFAIDHFKYFFLFFFFFFKILCQIKCWHLFKIIEAFTNDLLVKPKV